MVESDAPRAVRGTRSGPVVGRRECGHHGSMKQTSLVQAKAHLSELVDAAEHRGVSTVIHRHGKPSAVLVPLAAALPKATPPMKQSDVEALRAAAAAYDEDPGFSAVEDTREGR